jgi:hypothetical protein
MGIPEVARALRDSLSRVLNAHSLGEPQPPRLGRQAEPDQPMKRAAPRRDFKARHHAPTATDEGSERRNTPEEGHPSACAHSRPTEGAKEAARADQHSAATAQARPSHCAPCFGLIDHSQVRANLTADHVPRPMIRFAPFEQRAVLRKQGPIGPVIIGLAPNLPSLKGL